MVLVGNLTTADALDALGVSAMDWSRQGHGIASALGDPDDGLNGDLQYVMDGLTQAISLITDVQVFIAKQGIANVSSEGLAELPHEEASISSFIQMADCTRGGCEENEVHSLLQTLGRVRSISVSVDVEPNHVDRFLDLMEPIFQKVQEWDDALGDDVWRGIDELFRTVDHVLGIFDKITSMNPPSANDDVMVHHTFNIFDVSGTGSVSAHDFSAVLKKYKITSLSGKTNLVRKYDDDGDGNLSRVEFQRFVQDPDIPDVMVVVLRSYAKSLSQVAGVVKGAKMRGDLADAVASYLELVCGKNKTKVDWVSQALTNGSLPMNFTADVLAQLALDGQRVGKRVVLAMARLGRASLESAVDLVTNEEFWYAEGFPEELQSEAVKRLNKWLAAADVLEISKTKTLTRVYGRRAREQGTEDPEAARLVNSGVRAQSESLRFAGWLASNASRTSQQLLQDCFQFSQTSSNEQNSVADRVNSMVKRMTNFLRMLRPFVSPNGLEIVAGLRNFSTQQGVPSVEPLVHETALATAPDMLLGINRFLSTLQQVLPLVVDDLRIARTVVTSVASELDDIFGTFSVAALPVFPQLASNYRILWMIYFCCVSVFCPLAVVFACWLAGFQDNDGTDDRAESTVPSTEGSHATTIFHRRWSLANAFESTNIFWTAVMLGQVVVVGLFAVSVLLSLLGGSKALITKGCTEIHILSDETVCSESFATVVGWLPFLNHRLISCENLLTCRLVSGYLNRSAILTILGSGFAAILSFQLIIESGVKHERAVWLRSMTNKGNDNQED
uniref:EF-hand domain-containing protein n=1 Tax=Noctiluca scintillans TaxID=2966 RepID=A0A7S1B1G2_NOCSC